jgi:hypothetical protein
VNHAPPDTPDTPTRTNAPDTDARVCAAAACLAALAYHAPAKPTGPRRHRAVRLLSDLAPAACTRAGLTADETATIPVLALTINALLHLSGVRPHELARHLDTLTPTPAAITAAARAALSCGERATIAETLLAAGWRATAVYGSCGALIEAIYTAPDQFTTARLVTKDHASRPGSGHWLITHPQGSEPSTAEATTPAPVLAAFLLTLTTA